MQAIEPTRLTRCFGLVAAVILLLALGIQGGPDVLGAARADVDNPYEEAGITGFREYRSPHWGWGVEWDAGWDLDDEYDPPVHTDARTRHDRLHLAWSGKGGDSATVTFQGAPTDLREPADELDAFTDPGWIDDAWNDRFEVTPILTSANDDSALAVYVVLDTVDDVRFVTIFETRIEHGDWVFITVTAPEPSLPVAFEATITGFVLNGAPILTGVSWDEIEDALADAA
jgi:hypothetical protein